MFTVISKPRARTRARSLASSIRRGKSLDAFQQFNSVRRRFADFRHEVQVTLSDAKTWVYSPLIGDERVQSVSDFLRDFAAISESIRNVGSATRLEYVEKELLSAVLSWRIALEDCRLKMLRNVHADNRPLSTAERYMVANARRALESGTERRDLVRMMASAGFKVEQFKV